MRNKGDFFFAATAPEMLGAWREEMAIRDYVSVFREREGGRERGRSKTEQKEMLQCNFWLYFFFFTLEKKVNTVSFSDLFPPLSTEQ